MTVNPQDMLDRYLEAEEEVLAGREVKMNGKSLTLADLPDIRAGRREWERRVERQKTGGGPAFVRFV
ncbi:primosomal replication protein PriB/PriC domain protein [Halomonas sp. ND22Bw]|uniref:primosomal replication protein PriB/PriC domain protein n=1 Tax=Halomonas sp. ND22Bw TaxID=2054178 RepID=UPI000D0B0562|nr:primosomal replication protein PriB/PriC domain protein [Halomonas sp. ND22Bw]